MWCEGDIFELEGCYVLLIWTLVYYLLEGTVTAER